MPIQTSINTSLSRATGGPLFATTVSFTGGTLLLYLLLWITRSPVPSMHQFLQLPLWMLIGGFIGANIVFTAIMLSPRLSILTYFLALLAGQMTLALLLDHYGLFGYEKAPIHLWRFIGVCLVIIGALLTRIR